MLTNDDVRRMFAETISFRCPFCKTEQTNTRIFISSSGYSEGLQIVLDDAGELRWKSETAARGRTNPANDHVDHTRIRVLCPSCARQFDPTWLQREGHMEPGDGAAVMA